MKYRNDGLGQTLSFGFDKSGSIMTAMQTSYKEKNTYNYESRRHLQIAAAADLNFSVLPKVVNSLKRSFPFLSVDIYQMESHELESKITNGAVSLALGYIDNLHKDIYCHALGNIEPMVLRTDRRPGFLTINEYCSRKHVQMRPTCNVCHKVDTALSNQGKERVFAAALNRYDELSRTLANTDYLATVPSYIANALAEQGGVRIERTPFIAESKQLMMIWSTKPDQHPDEVWLRQHIARLLAAAAIR